MKPGNTPPRSGAPAHATLQNPVPMGKVRGRGEATVTSPSPWSGGTRAPAHWQPNAKSRAVWGGLRPPSHINCYRPGSVGGPGGSRARGAGWACVLLPSPAAVSRCHYDMRCPPWLFCHEGQAAGTWGAVGRRGHVGRVRASGAGASAAPPAPLHNIKYEVAYTTTGMATWRETSVGGAPADGRSGGPAPLAGG